MPSPESARIVPAGQPWGYPVMNPDRFFSRNGGEANRPGPALQFVRARVERLLEDFDGIRIDHPHGLVCPWVYRSDDAAPFRAVQNGARLYSSPQLPDHPGLARFSLVRPGRLRSPESCPRYADDRVSALSAEEADRFAVVLDTILSCAKSSGRTHDDVLCEVLSTWPAPLKAVMKQRGLGRFCVTQKSDPNNPDDIYRSENTSACDWIMVGTHDTKPLWLIAEERKQSEWMRDRSGLLARRLVPDRRARQAFAAQTASDPHLFCDAMFAELFLGPAGNVSVFFSDLFGMMQPYNEPGTVGKHNWTLRVPSGYEADYRRKVEAGEAFNIEKALAMALAARSPALGSRAVALAERLCRGQADGGAVCKGCAP